MSTKIKSSRARDELRFKQASTATPKYINNALTLEGQTVTPQQIVATFNAVSQADTDLDAARAAVAPKLQAQRAALAAARLLYAALKAYLIGAYGKKSSVLVEFGMAPAQPKAPTAETRAVAVAKSKATREARHTMGKRQRSQVHGSAPAPQAPPIPAQPQGQTPGGK